MQVQTKSKWPTLGVGHFPGVGGVGVGHFGGHFGICLSYIIWSTNMVNTRCWPYKLSVGHIYLLTSFNRFSKNFLSKTLRNHPAFGPLSFPKNEK